MFQNHDTYHHCHNPPSFATCLNPALEAFKMVSRRRTSGVSVLTFTKTYLDIHWLQISVPKANVCLIPVHFFRFLYFKINMAISRKDWLLHVFVVQSCWVWPGISAQTNRQIATQSRLRSAQNVRNIKFKKRPFPGPSQELKKDHFQVLHKRSALRDSNR